MAASDVKEIIEKIKNGKVTVQGKSHKPLKPNEKKEDSPGPNPDESESVKPEKPKEPKADEPVNETSKPPKIPKVAAFPIDAQINIYGYLGLSKPDLRAIGLTTIDGKGKLTANVKVQIISFNPESKEFIVKIP